MIAVRAVFWPVLEIIMVLIPRADLEPIFLLGIIANILRIQSMKGNPNHE